MQRRGLCHGPPPHRQCANNADREGGREWGGGAVSRAVPVRWVNTTSPPPLPSIGVPQRRRRMLPPPPRPLHGPCIAFCAHNVVIWQQHDHCEQSQRQSSKFPWRAGRGNGGSHTGPQWYTKGGATEHCNRPPLKMIDGLKGGLGRSVDASRSPVPRAVDQYRDTSGPARAVRCTT